VSTSGQPEIAIWPPKPEIVIPLELQQIASKFQRQVPDFRSWRARIKRLHVIATTGNGKDVLGANLAIFGSRLL